MIVFEIPYDVLVMNFGQNCNLRLALLLILLAQMYFLDSRKHSCCYVESFVDPTWTSSSYHFAYLPLLNSSIFGDEIISYYSVFTYLKQKRNIGHNWSWLLLVIGRFDDLRMSSCRGTHYIVLNLACVSELRRLLMQCLPHRLEFVVNWFFLHLCRWVSKQYYS